jgi:hypothetical protein
MVLANNTPINQVLQVACVMVSCVLDAGVLYSLVCWLQES